jgi:hypothetical protein
MKKKLITYRKIGKNHPAAALHLNQYEVKVEGVSTVHKSSHTAKPHYREELAKHGMKIEGRPQ